MKLLYKIVFLIIATTFLSCNRKSNETIISNNKSSDNYQKKTGEIVFVNDKYQMYYLEYFDDKYIVFYEGSFLKYVYRNKVKYKFVDYYPEDTPLFILENNDLVFFECIINDVLIYTCGTWGNPLWLTFIDLTNGNDLLGSSYFYKDYYFKNDHIILKEIGHQNKLSDEQLKFLDKNIYEKALELEISRGGNKNNLIYYQAYSYDFINKKTEPMDRIITFSFE